MFVSLDVLRHKHAYIYLHAFVRISNFWIYIYLAMFNLTAKKLLIKKIK